MSSWQQALGAIVRGDATQFRVWAESGPPGAVIFWSRCAIVEEE